VLDIDFHEDGRHLFPGTGFIQEIGEGKASGLKINVPLSLFTNDENYLKLFRSIVPTVVRKFHPQVLLLQCGVDSHANDLLAHLQITTKAYGEIASTVHELAHEVADGRLVVFGGGGYNISNVARTWTLVASTLVGYSPPKSIPESWRKLFEALVGETAPDRLESQGEARPELSQNITANEASDVMQGLKRLIPLLAG